MLFANLDKNSRIEINQEKNIREKIYEEEKYQCNYNTQK